MSTSTISPKCILNRALIGAGVAVSLLPLLILLLFYAYVIRVHLALGHFPQPYSPESWRMGFELHYAMLRPWFLVFPLGWLPVVAAALDLGVWAIARRFPSAAFVALGVSSLLVYGSIVLDPGQFIVWFMD